MIDNSDGEKIGFTKSFSNVDNNEFVSLFINEKVDPNAVYNTIPFYAKLPAIFIILLICAPLGIFLLWKYQRKHIIIPIAVTLIYIAYWFEKGFHYYDLISGLFNFFSTPIQ